MKISKTFNDTLEGPIVIMFEEIQKIKSNAINDEYAIIDEVNNVLTENYVQLTYLDEYYLNQKANRRSVFQFKRVNRTVLLKKRYRC